MGSIIDFDSFRARQEMMETARNYIGKIRYKHYRGPTEDQDPLEGMNCYGFYWLVLGESGVYLPFHGYREMLDLMSPTTAPQLADPIFREEGDNDQPGHVGFYDPLKETVIHLAKSLVTVQETDISWFHPINGFRSIGPYIEEMLRNERIRTDAGLAV